MNVECDFRDSFAVHVVLYAKGWYVRTGRGPLADLGDILSTFRGGGTVTSDNDVFNLVLGAFLFLVPPPRVRGALLEAFGRRRGRLGVVRDRNPEEVLLGALSDVAGEYAHLDLVLEQHLCKDLPEAAVIALQDARFDSKPRGL